MKDKCLKNKEKTANGFAVIFKTLCAAVSMVFLLILDKPYKINYGLFWVLFLNIYLLIVTFSDAGAFIVSVFLFIFNYSILSANYIFNIDSMFLTDSYTKYALTGFKILLVFMTVIVLFIDDKSFFNGSMILRTRATAIFDKKESGSSLIAFGYLLALALVFIFAYTRPAEKGERGEPSALYEYSIVIFIIGYYFFGKIKAYKFCSTILLLLFAFQNMVFGGRVTALQLAVVLFLFLFDGKFVPWRIIIPFGVVGIVIFVMIGSQRGGFSLSLSGMAEAIGSIFKEGASLDTAYSAYYTSLSFIKTEELLGFGERFLMFLKFCLSMIVGGSKVPDSNLSEYTRQYFVHYYGGVLPFYGHFYLGFAGVIAFGVIVALYMNLILKNKKRKNGVGACVSAYVIATVPRWYLYSPSPLIRGVALLAAVYFLTYFADSILKRIKQNVKKQNGKKCHVDHSL